MINNLQALRAFAALNVVFFHIIGTSEVYGLDVNYFKFLSGWGANGVDVFFVISGFIMVYIQTKKTRTAQSFFTNRIIRIAPIYWCLTMLYIGIYLVKPSVFNNYELSLGALVAALTFTSEALGYGHPILYVGWTLEYEMFFYLLFSLGILLKSEFRSFFTTILLLFVFVLLTGRLIVLEFVLGMVCAKIYLLNRYNKLGWASLLIGSLGLLTSIFYKTDIDRFYIYGIPAFFIVFGLINIKQLKNKVLVSLGDASYSIYLVQVFTIPLFYKIASKYMSDINNDLIAIVALLFTALAGYCVYICIENQISILLRGLMRKIKSKSNIT